MPPGDVGKYFEVRDSRGQWRPVSPDDIRPFEPIVFGRRRPRPARARKSPRITAAYSVRGAKGGWWMAALPRRPERGPHRRRGPVHDDASRRTPAPAFKLHFASCRLHAPGYPDPQGRGPRPAIDVTLGPTRRSGGRVIERPGRRPEGLSQLVGLHGRSRGQGPGRMAILDAANPNAHDPDHVKRHLEVRLPAGRYKIEFRSETVRRLRGRRGASRRRPARPARSHARAPGQREDGRQAGRRDRRDRPRGQAGEARRFPRQGRRARLLGHLVRAVHRRDAAADGISRQRFKDQPLVILALHDASIASFREYRKAVASLPEKVWGTRDLPFAVLLEPIADGQTTRADSPGPGEKGIGPDGRDGTRSTPGPPPSSSTPTASSWASSTSMRSKGRSRTSSACRGRGPAAKVAAGRGEPPPEYRDVKVRGKVVGPDGKPVAGAKLAAGGRRPTEGHHDRSRRRLRVHGRADPDRPLRAQGRGPGAGLRRLFTIPATGWSRRH